MSFRSLFPARMALAMLLAAAAVTARCGSSAKTGAFSNTVVKEAGVGAYEKAAETIDRGNTRQFYFTLAGAVPCVKFGAGSDYVLDRFSGEKIGVKTYIIVEQAVDLPRFDTGKENTVYTEVGRNFDVQWNWKKYFTLCTGDHTPLVSFRPGGRYRVRFTAFEDQNYTARFELQADAAITVYDAEPPRKRPGDGKIE